MRLDAAALDRLDPAVARPRYARDAVGVGVVHLGIGAFHRAHQAVYFDDLLAAEGDDWRILGVSLRSATVRDQLVPQDGLYTLVERDGGETRLRVIGSVAGVLVAREGVGAVIEAVARPATQLVTLTVTEKGYCHDPATGTLNFDHPDIAHDLADPHEPVSAIGVLAAALDLRRRNDRGPITLMSCDNLPHNGSVLAEVLCAFARARDSGLADWISAHAAFPATMVDRIVPATTDADRAALAATLGCDDAAMVKAEPFSQWVIEDRFAGARPALDRVGAQFVADVRPFELAKLRMLNGAHSTLAYLGLARGHAFVHEAIADPAIRATVTQLMREAAATLPAVPGLDPAGYAEALIARFANAALEHRLAQIAMDGSQKLPQRLLATIAEAHAAGGEATAAAAGVAAWMRHIPGPWLNDPLAAPLRTLAAADDPVAALCGYAPVFGDLGGAPWFRALIRRAWDETA